MRYYSTTGDNNAWNRNARVANLRRALYDIIREPRMPSEERTLLGGASGEHAEIIAKVDRAVEVLLRANAIPPMTGENAWRNWRESEPAGRETRSSGGPPRRQAGPATSQATDSTGIEVTQRELATLLAALRKWQYEPDLEMDYFFPDVGPKIDPLNDSEIEALHERLNRDRPLAVNNEDRGADPGPVR